jgi:quercetin dioxygenase-like cupin family protein
MTRRMELMRAGLGIRLGAWFAVLTTLWGLAGIATAQEASQTPKVWASEELKWEHDKTLASVQSVLLWGNPQQGEHAMLRKFPAGYAPPPHKHPSAERVVVVAGTIVVRYAGSAEKRLGPGSYSEIPANMEHAVKCADEAECVFVLASPGPFAIMPVPNK